MTQDELDKQARFSLDFAVRSLRETGEFRQMFHLIRRSREDVMILVDGQITNSDGGKANLARQIRRHIAELGDVEAVLMMADAWQAILTEQQMRMKQALGLTLAQAAAAGLCNKQEAISVMAESPSACFTLKQIYRRGKNDEIILEGEPEKTDDNRSDVNAEFQGRFQGWFEK